MIKGIFVVYLLIPFMVSLGPFGVFIGLKMAEISCERIKIAMERCINSGGLNSIKLDSFYCKNGASFDYKEVQK